MTADQWILLGVFAGTIVLIFATRLRPDLVALLAALSLALTGVISEGEVLSGLSSSVVTTLIGLFILARGLEETGLLRWAAARITEVGGSSENRVLLTLMITAAGLSIGMNNLAVGALLLPASLRVAQRAQIPVSSLLLPVAYSTLLGGMATYFTTANIIMSDLLTQQGSRPLGMRDFALTGGLVAVAGMVFLATVGRRLLPSKGPSDADPRGDYFGLYKLGERFWELRISPDSGLVGKTIGESQVGRQLGITILAIRRRGRLFLVPGPGIAILPGDEIVALGREDRIRTLVEWGGELRSSTSPEHFQHELELTELVVSPRSRVRGKTVAELDLRTRYGVNALALWREGEVIRTDVGSTPLEVGDGLLVVNLPRRLERLADTGDFLVAGAHVAAPSRPERAGVAVAIFGAVLGASFTGLLPIGEIVLTGALAMVLTGCLTLEDAYDSIEWNVLFLIAGLLPLGFAMIDTGLAQRAAELLGGFAERGRPLALVGMMFAVTVAVTQIIGGQVSPLLVGPVALAVANTAGMDPRAMAVAVAIGASTAFLTPTAHPVNAMVMGTGGYRPSHYLRIGVGMTFVTFVALLAGMWLFWGIH